MCHSSRIPGHADVPGTTVQVSRHITVDLMSTLSDTAGLLQSSTYPPSAQRIMLHCLYGTYLFAELPFCALLQVCMPLGVKRARW